MLRIGLLTAFVGVLVLGPSTSFAFDDSAALRGINSGLVTPQPGPIIGTEETCDVPARS
jgi:hypothetical protein